MKQFSKTNLKLGRTTKHLSLREAARRINEHGCSINYSTLHQYENLKKHYNPSSVDMPAICHVYERPLEYFYEPMRKTNEIKAAVKQ